MSVIRAEPSCVKPARWSGVVTLWKQKSRFCTTYSHEGQRLLEKTCLIPDEDRMKSTCASTFQLKNIPLTCPRQDLISQGELLSAVRYKEFDDAIHEPIPAPWGSRSISMVHYCRRWVSYRRRLVLIKSMQCFCYFDANWMWRIELTPNAASNVRHLLPGETNSENVSRLRRQPHQEQLTMPYVF